MKYEHLTNIFWAILTVNIFQNEHLHGLICTAHQRLRRSATWNIWELILLACWRTLAGLQSPLEIDYSEEAFLWLLRRAVLLSPGYPPVSDNLQWPIFADCR